MSTFFQLYGLNLSWKDRLTLPKCFHGFTAATPTQNATNCLEQYLICSQSLILCFKECSYIRRQILWLWFPKNKALYLKKQDLIVALPFPALAHMHTHEYQCVVLSKQRRRWNCQEIFVTSEIRAFHGSPLTQTFHELCFGLPWPWAEEVWRGRRGNLTVIKASTFMSWLHISCQGVGYEETTCGNYP